MCLRNEKLFSPLATETGTVSAVLFVFLQKLENIVHLMLEHIDFPMWGLEQLADMIHLMSDIVPDGNGQQEFYDMISCCGSGCRHSFTVT